MGVEEYKYWFIYIYYENEYEFYAYTDQKEILKYFKRDRNMKKFKIEKKKISKEYVNYLAKEYKDLYLEIFSARTKNLESDSYTIEKVKIAITQREKLTINNFAANLIFVKLWETIECEPYVFKPNFLRSLTFIHYTEAYDYINTYESPNDILSFYEPDYIEIFINLYGDLLLI